MLWSQVATPDRIRNVLSEEPIDIGVLDNLLSKVGFAAADALLDGLAEADSSQTRRLLLDRLIRLGPEVGPLVVQRLEDERWYVLRNSLWILSELPDLPRDFRPGGGSDDQRVAAVRVLGTSKQ